MREVTLEDCKFFVHLETLPYLLHMQKGISIEKAKEFVDSLGETELKVMIDESAQVLFESIFKGLKILEESEDFLVIELDSMIKGAGGLDKFNAWVKKYGIEHLVVRGEFGHVFFPKKDLFRS